MNNSRQQQRRQHKWDTGADPQQPHEQWEPGKQADVPPLTPSMGAACSSSESHTADMALIAQASPLA